MLYRAVFILCTLCLFGSFDMIPLPNSKHIPNTCYLIHFDVMPFRYIDIQNFHFINSSFSFEHFHIVTQIPLVSFSTFDCFSIHSPKSASFNADDKAISFKSIILLEAINTQIHAHILAEFHPGHRLLGNWICFPSRALSTKHWNRAVIARLCTHRHTHTYVYENKSYPPELMAFVSSNMQGYTHVHSMWCASLINCFSATEILILYSRILILTFRLWPFTLYIFLCFTYDGMVFGFFVNGTASI